MSTVHENSRIEDVGFMISTENPLIGRKLSHDYVTSGLNKNVDSIAKCENSA
ncbi:hypothetical protein DPMN_174531 [Dreissena polymorpha]|uniref:Uncharacterized protein n=1 Tax=Dreissena polymorpha TaxID=45954 RepID=A0A9D4E4T1_DREPO|nr:hypothetical protein DPMN_174531 [Dreissena polymorpha]